VDGAGQGTAMAGDWILPLDRCAWAARDLVGGKALGLGHLVAAGLPVPPGWCATTQAFAAFRSWTPVGEVIATGVRELAAHPVATGRILRTIRAAIETTEIPPVLRRPLELAAAALLVGGPVVVRSSAPDEDGGGSAYAGGHYSSGPLADTAEVLDAVRLCWASAFSDRALYYGRGRPRGDMAVVVQRWVRPERSGVLFTRHPLSPADAAQPVAEVALGEARVTDGDGDMRAFPLSGEDPDCPELPPPLRQALRACVAPAEALMRGAADLEWVWDGSALHVVQIRPVVVRAGPRVQAPVCRALEDVDSVYGLPLGRCQPLFMSKLLKKVWFRRACRQAGIGVFGVWYLVHEAAGDLRAAVRLVGEQVRTPFVRLDWGDGRPLRVPLAGLEAALGAGAVRNPVCGGDWACVEVGEVLHGEVAGLATCLPDGQTLIQAVPSAVKGLRQGTVEPSVFVTDAEGRVRLDRPATFAVHGRVGPDGFWLRVPCSPYVLRLTDADLAAITRATRLLSAALGEVRVEWCLEEGRVLVKDLSVETKAISTQVGDRVLAPGFAAGTAVVLRDLSEFEDVARRYHISVVADSRVQEAAQEAEPVQRLRDLARRQGPLILVADHPAVGLIPTIAHVRGFVFARGALLCHMAIALREAGVPAVVLPGATERFHDGDRLVVSPEGVQHVPAPERTVGAS
jgi:phosphohistidine swiveling domain-containing protein